LLFTLLELNPYNTFTHLQSLSSVISAAGAFSGFLIGLFFLNYKYPNLPQHIKKEDRWLGILLLALGILFLREFNFFLDLFSYLSFVGILVFLFQFDLELFENKIISLSVTWFLLQAGPGRNFGFSSLFSLLSVITTAIISYLLWKEEWSFPPMLVVFIFFTVQSLFFIIVMEKFLQKIPFLKSVFKK